MRSSARERRGGRPDWALVKPPSKASAPQSVFPSYHCKELNLVAAAWPARVVLAASRALGASRCRMARLYLPRPRRCITHKSVRSRKRMVLLRPCTYPAPPAHAPVSPRRGYGHFAKLKRGPHASCPPAQHHGSHLWRAQNTVIGVGVKRSTGVRSRLRGLANSPNTPYALHRVDCCSSKSSRNLSSVYTTEQIASCRRVPRKPSFAKYL